MWCTRVPHVHSSALAAQASVVLKHNSTSRVLPFKAPGRLNAVLRAFHGFYILVLRSHDCLDHHINMPALIKPPHVPLERLIMVIQNAVDHRFICFSVADLTLPPPCHGHMLIEVPAASVILSFDPKHRAGKPAMPGCIIPCCVSSCTCMQIAAHQIHIRGSAH